MSTDTYIDIGPNGSVETLHIGHVHSLSYQGPGGFDLREWLEVLAQACPIITSAVLEVMAPVIAMKHAHYAKLRGENPEWLAAHWGTLPDWDDLCDPDLVDDLRPFLGQPWSMRVD